MKTKGNINRTLIFLWIGTLILGSGCSLGVEGYGVMVWPPEDVPGIQPGIFVTVLDQSRLKKTYTMTLEGTNQKVETDTWRIKFFSNPGEAREFQKKFQDVKDLWGFAQRKSLPVRSAMTNSSESLWRLDQGEKLKILEKASEKVKVGALEGTWYKVLTKSGKEGYCFDTALKLVVGSDNAVASSGAAGDKYQSIFLENTWRPEYFDQMIRDEAIDVARFKPEFKLQPIPEESLIKLNLPEDPKPDSKPINMEFKFTGITTISQNQFRFDGPNPLTVQFKTGADRCYVSFKLPSNISVTKEFRLFKDEGKIEEIMNGEMARRQGLLNALLSRGTKFVSDGFGTLVIGGDKNFVWEDTPDNKIQKMFGIKAVQTYTGTVSFDRFLEKSVIGKGYSWVITFAFNQEDFASQVKKKVNLLYRLSENGLVMEPAREGNGGFFIGPIPGTVPLTFTFAP